MYRNTFPQIFKPHYQAMFLYFFLSGTVGFTVKELLQIYTVGYADIFIDPHPQKPAVRTEDFLFITSSSMPHYP